MQSQNPSQPVRRPIAARDTRWARGLSRACVRLGLTPNAISLLGFVFSLAAGVLLLFSPEVGDISRAAMLLGAAVLIQFRLLCNMIDGMVAIEGGKQSAAGPIFNELPDRFSDAVTLIGVGAAIPHFDGGITLAWLAALLAIITAYVRSLGASEGTPQHFFGPMAKQQRMALVTLACVIACFEPMWDGGGEVFAVTLGIIILGCAVTIARRTRRIIADLNEAQP